MDIDECIEEHKEDARKTAPRNQGETDCYTQDTKKDLEFLKEIREKISEGYERGDPSQIQYALQMINDWIDELEGLQPTVRL